MFWIKPNLCYVECKGLATYFQYFYDLRDSVILMITFKYKILNININCIITYTNGRLDLPGPTQEAA